MIEFLSNLILGAALGYSICMFKVNELQEKVNQLKIDAMHERRKRHIIGALSAKSKGDK